jgi:hypothetical protein
VVRDLGLLLAAGCSLLVVVVGAGTYRKFGFWEFLGHLNRTYSTVCREFGDSESWDISSGSFGQMVRICVGPSSGAWN